MLVPAEQILQRQPALPLRSLARAPDIFTFFIIRFTEERPFSTLRTLATGWKLRCARAVAPTPNSEPQQRTALDQAGCSLPWSHEFKIVE
jgi:hypothetical protein